MKRELTESTLKKLRVTPDKGRGQNFITEPAIIDDIVRFGRPAAGETLVEIGPGLGALTRELVGFGTLHAIEIEPAFCKYLQESFPDLILHNEDIRGFDLTTLGRELVVFGNIPYSCSSEILFFLLDNAHLNNQRVIKRAVLLVQQEFAERVASGPGTKSYGIPSIRTALLANTRLGPIFPGDIFVPPASVMSQVIELRFLEAPRFHISDMLGFQNMLAICFSSRRRKIFNTLLASNQYGRENIEQALAKSGIDHAARVEQISPEQFVNLFEPLGQR